MEIAVTIKRFNPIRDEGPYKEEHKISVDGKGRLTILDALQIIKEREDGGLSFRCSCRSGICGSCAVRVNGNEALACTTDILEISKRYGKVIIEPLKNLNVIKDLVVDLRPMWDRLKKSGPWLVSDGVQEFKWDKRIQGSLDTSSGCILCGACYSDCEAFKVDPDFLGPAVFNKGYRFVIDPRDRGRKDRLKRLAESGLWHCSHCYLCSSICPKGINPKDSISYLRNQAYRMGLRDDPGARYLDGFYRGVKKRGRLSELLIFLKVKGVNIVKEIPFFSKVLIHGKVPWLKKPILNIDEVRKIYDIVERRREARG